MALALAARPYARGHCRVASAAGDAVRNAAAISIWEFVEMRTTLNLKRVAGAALAAALSLAAIAALADIKDYEFQLVESEIKQGDGVTVAVRLIDKKSGEPVPDAVIFATRMDMAPDGMAAMTTPIEAMPSTEPGLYRFKTNLVMAGGWQLSIAAKIQGETGTVEDRLVLKAVQ